MLSRSQYRMGPKEVAGTSRSSQRLRHLGASVLLLLVVGCGESHAPIEVPEHPGPKPKSPPQGMTAPPAEVKPRTRNQSTTSATLWGSLPIT
jgi:hypothetical protein